MLSVVSLGYLNYLVCSSFAIWATLGLEIVESMTIRMPRVGVPNSCGYVIATNFAAARKSIPAGAATFFTESPPMEALCFGPG